MPRILFYAGTAFCLFVALSSAAEGIRQLAAGGSLVLPLVGPGVAGSALFVVVSVMAGIAIASIFLRMAALLAPRNLFGAFFAVFSVTAAVTALVSLALFRGIAPADGSLARIAVAVTITFGFFVALAILSLRPYFRVQASRFLSLAVFFPLPLFAATILPNLFGAGEALPMSSPASALFFASLAMVFFAISVHCVRHRYPFIEPTNLREILDARVDPAGRPIRLGGGVAFDS